MVEDLILSNLIHNEEYGRKVIPFLRSEYFHSRTDKVLFNVIEDHVTKFNTFPNKVALTVEVENATTLSEDEHKTVQAKIDTLDPQDGDLGWLVSQTEKFCKDKAIFNAISESIKILDDKTGKTTPGTIPSLLESALAVSFDTNIGHDFFENAEDRYAFYHRKESRIPFDLDYLNKITKGGLPNKTLNVVLAGCVHPETKIRIRIKK